MATRVTTTSVTFARPFRLPDEDGEQPPQHLPVEIEEELLESGSHSAYRRRVSTVIHCHAAGVITRFVTIDPDALSAALERDARVL